MAAQLRDREAGNVAVNLAWWTFPSDSKGGSYGQITDPLGPYDKPDVNFRVPYGLPITSLTGGVVTDVSDHGYCCGGLSVVVLMDRPLNKLATHVAYNFLGSAVVRVGQRVNLGDEVGTAGSKYGIDFALALTADNSWGGPTFYLNGSGNPLLDPHLLLNSRFGVGFGGGNGTIGYGSNYSGLGMLAPAFISVSNTTHDILNNVPGFQGICEGLDNVETFVPFKLVSTGGQDVGILGHLPFVGQDIQNAANLATLPSDSVQAVLTFVTANTIVVVIRLAIILIGVIIVMALIRNAIANRIETQLQGIEDFSKSATGRFAGQVIAAAAA